MERGITEMREETMARFYASIRGYQGEATSMGSAASGITGHVRSLNVGAQVDCYVNGEGNDVVEVWRTGGSNGHAHRILIARFIDKESK